MERDKAAVTIRMNYDDDDDAEEEEEEEAKKGSVISAKMEQIGKYPSKFSLFSCE